MDEITSNRSLDADGVLISRFILFPRYAACCCQKISILYILFKFRVS